MSMPRPRPEHERGQVLVVFTLALVAIVAITGLVLDGGSTFVQRRDQQNVADAAAMAGGYAYANGGVAAAAARQNATANGITDGTDGASVNVTVTTASTGTTIVVTITKPHRNAFSGLVGFPSWDVTTTATVVTGIPNGVVGAMPIIFNKKAVKYGQTNELSYDEPGTGPQDVPQGSSQFNWTVFCTANGNPCNGDSATVDAIINSRGKSTVVTLDQLIGPLDAGAHTTLFSDLAGFVPGNFPVAIVNDTGALQGWAMFHLTGSVGGSTKQIRGWFVSPINPEAMKIVGGATPGTTNFGSYVVQLVN